MTIIDLINNWQKSFQLTRSRGAWLSGLCALYIVSLHFNSHAHVERDDFGKKAYKPRKYFNSHAHVERDINSLFHSIFTANFNSHAHVERDMQID